LPSSTAEVAAAGDLHRVLQGLGQVGEQFGHLGAGLEVLLGAEALGPPLVAQHVALGDADARLVRLVVVALMNCTGCVATSGRPRRAARSALAATSTSSAAATIAPAGTLHFDVIGAGEQACPGLGTHIGLVQLAGRQQLPDVAQRAARERDQAAVVALP
jgi:hypothetical protein